MKIAFFTLGCKVNQYETQVLEQLFSAEGFDIVDSDEQADVYVINSCTVTATGDKKTRQMLRRFQRQNPAALLALTGCMPQAFPEEAELLKDVHVITGSKNRKGLIKAVLHSLATGERVVDVSKHEAKEDFEEMQATDFSSRTRAFVKIQDGCERYCAYCVIPIARGPVRSKKPEILVQEVQTLVEAGFQEIVLVGINLSCYGMDLGLGLIDAVEAVCKCEGISRVRLGSLEPELLTDDCLQRLAAQPKFCPQFHLSLQSGCDETLARMDRQYTTKEYSDLVEKIRSFFKNSAITTDIMVGFPGETDEEFVKTVSFVEEIGLAKAHVFQYSRRKGTAADLMENQVPEEVKAARSKVLIQTTKNSRKKFLESQVGLSVSVLLETRENGGWIGYSENYTPVWIAGDDSRLEGNIQEVVITEAEKDFCKGFIKGE